MHTNKISGRHQMPQLMMKTMLRLRTRVFQTKPGARYCFNSNRKHKIIIHIYRSAWNISKLTTKLKTWLNTEPKPPWNRTSTNSRNNWRKTEGRHSPTNRRIRRITRGWRKLSHQPIRRRHLVVKVHRKKHSAAKSFLYIFFPADKSCVSGFWCYLNGKPQKNNNNQEISNNLI